MAAIRSTEDATLVELTRKGDMAAFAELVRTYSETARGVAWSIVGSVEDAADVAQEALVAAYTKLDQLREPARFGPWLMTIVRSRALNMVSRHTRHNDFFQRGDPEHIDPDSVIREYILNNELADIREAIDELPSMYREIILLRYWQDYSYDEISEILDVPLTTVKGRLYQSRQRLRRKLGRSIPDYTSKFFPRGRRVLDYDLYEPSGYLACTWQSGDDRVGVTVIDIESGDVIREFEDPPNAQNVRISPDGSAIAFNADGIRSRRTVWYGSIDGGTAEPILDEEGHVASCPSWRPDGKALSYFHVMPDDSDRVRSLLEHNFALYEFDLVTGDSRRISDATIPPMSRICINAEWTSTGNRLAYPFLRHEFLNYWPGVAVADRDTDGSWLVRAIPIAAGEMATISHTCWAPDGEHLAVLSGRKERSAPKTVSVLRVTDFATIWSFTSDRISDTGFSPDGTHVWCATEREFLWLDWPSGTITHRLSTLGLPAYYWRDFDPNVRPSADGQSIWFLDGNDRGYESLIRRWRIGGACEPFDLPPSKLDDLGPVVHRVEEETFTARDGLQIPIKRYIPSNPHDMAVLVLGPVIRKWILARLLRENYEIVQIRWRRQVGDYIWEDWAREIGNVDAVDAVEGGFHWARTYGSGRKLAILGESGGAFLAFRALREARNPFACGVALNPVTSVEGWEAGWAGRLDPKERNEIVRERSPVEHAADVRRPLLMIKAMRSSTPPDDLATIAERMNATGIPCELQLYDDNELLCHHRDEICREIFDFFAHHSE